MTKSTFIYLLSLSFLLPMASASATGEWTCIPEGHACSFDSDCCSGNCVNDPKLGPVCK